MHNVASFESEVAYLKQLVGAGIDGDICTLPSPSSKLRVYPTDPQSLGVLPTGTIYNSLEQGQQVFQKRVASGKIAEFAAVRGVALRARTRRGY